MHKQGQVSTQFALIQPKYEQNKQTNHAKKPINAHARQSKNTDAKNRRNYTEIRPRSQFSQPGQDHIKSLKASYPKSATKPLKPGQPRT